MQRWKALFLLMIPLAIAGCENDAQYRGGYGPPQSGAPAIGYGYDNARAIGHRDGMQAAYRDMQDRRSPDPRRHNEFRRPPVDGRARDEYRNGFANGYSDAYRRGTRDRDDDRR